MLPDNSNSRPGVVKRMREISDEISEKLLNMTWEEQKAYYKEQTLKLDPHFYERMEQKQKNNQMPQTV
jgi:hypothetical protein